MGQKLRVVPVWDLQTGNVKMHENAFSVEFKLHGFFFLDSFIIIMKNTFFVKNYFN